MPKYYNGRIFQYYRTHNFGATATRYVYKLPFFGLFEIPIESNVRCEVAYKMETYYNTHTYNGGNWVVDGRKQVDQVAYALEVGKDFMPKFITKYNGQRVWI